MSGNPDQPPPYLAAWATTLIPLPTHPQNQRKPTTCVVLIKAILLFFFTNYEFVYIGAPFTTRDRDNDVYQYNCGEA